MIRRSTLIALLTATLSAPVGAAELTPALQRKLGLVTVVATADRSGSTASGFARVLDVSPLASLDADLLTARAAANASAAEARRTRDLAAADATVAVRVAEAAAAQARADSLRVELLKRRLGLEWGPIFISMGDARRSALISDLAAGRAALVRLDAPAGLAGIRQARVSRPGGRALGVQVLGPARMGDPRYQTPGLLGVVTGAGAADFAVGQVYPISLSVAGASGVLLPRSALLRAGGQTFVYVRKDATHFDRRNLGPLQPGEKGVLALSGVRAGEAVVATGAAALYAAENQPKGEDE